ncbi:YraN family protein [Candidatus Peregrinibacteria bacterium]|nr:YraN family protein [Candidatus Peregrinibacteria bacterium]
MAPHLLVGREGEDIAARYLRSEGYKILGRNVHVGKKDEIDILAFDQNEKITVFVEVKAREHSGEYAPELNITWGKRTAMARAAERWITQRNLDVPYRLDVICVSEGRVVGHYKEIET